MNVLGLQNLGLAPQTAAKAAKGNASEKGDKKSFEDILAQKEDARPAPQKTDDKPAPRSPFAQKSAIGPKPQGKFSSKLNSQPQKQQTQSGTQPQSQPSEEGRGEVRETAVDEQGLPAQPTAPSFDGPMLNDRIMNAPMAPTVTPATAKQPTAANQDAEVDSLTKRVVWQDFLRKMKDDLGVSAEDVMSAFQSLSPEELAKPPAQTVDKIVMALGLDGQQASMAKQYFMDLINRTQPKTMGEEIVSSQKQISLSLMSQREMDRRRDTQAVDQMQQKFFMKGQYQRPQDAIAASNAPMNYVPKAQQDEDGNVFYTNPELESEDTAATTMGAGVNPPVTTPTEGQPVNNGPAPTQMQSQAAPTNKLVDQMQPVTKQEKEEAAVDSVVKKFMQGQGQSSMVRGNSAASAAAAMAPAATASAVAAPAPVAPAAQAAQAAIAQILGKASTDSGSDTEGDSEYTSDASNLGAMAGMNTAHKPLAAAGNEFQNQLKMADPAQPMTAQDLVQNARIMMRDGGGEMKVTLTPEGLGEVAMKVTVHDGKVNVQMITESDEAKKLLERQMGELKASLSNHHLSLDGLKVDTASSIGKQMEQQYQDAQRQATQQSMEQFRQDTGAWKRSFFETPALREYKGAGNAPKDIPNPSSSSASSRRAGSRRLDLVA